MASTYAVRVPSPLAKERGLKTEARRIELAIRTFECMAAAHEVMRVRPPRREVGDTQLAKRLFEFLPCRLDLLRVATLTLVTGGRSPKESAE